MFTIAADDYNEASKLHFFLSISFDFFSHFIFCVPIIFFCMTIPVLDHCIENYSLLPLKTRFD